MGETYETNKAPISGKLPHNGAIRFIDEKALDLFTQSWNSKQVARNEPFRIDWVHDTNENKVMFNVTLR